MLALTGDQRDFLVRLGEIAFGNPFSAQRAELVGGLVPGVPLGNLTEYREALAGVVTERLASMATKKLGVADRQLVEPALLYVAYHRCVPQLDAFIERQARGGAAEPIAFAAATIGDLVREGFDAERATRLFSFFFQLRRAFYFIHRSLAGECESMRRLREALWNNVFTHDMRAYEAGLWGRMEDFSTLLLGETGTGKGQAAAAIGRSAFIPYLPAEQRFAANFADTFIAINLSQYPETLIESELFGHRKGAFTGAVDHHKGVFERCSQHGALFLDEIGEVSVPVQIKLLQILQDRSFTPLGGHERRRFSGRVIAATNRPLAGLRRESRFRDDFYYRLCSDVIEMPTLRQRIAESPAELEQLVAILVERIAGNPDRELVGEVLEALPRAYAWPGNVRELEQAVRRILLTGRYAAELVQPADEEASTCARLSAGELSADELLGAYCRLLYRRLGTYAEVAKRAGLDPRTARKYVENARSG